MPTIAVIGLGAMGSRIAHRLLDNGHDVSVWNRTRARMEPVAAAGATAHDSPADAGRDRAAGRRDAIGTDADRRSRTRQHRGGRCRHAEGLRRRDRRGQRAVGTPVVDTRLADERRRETLTTNQFALRFALALAVKDADLVSEAARQVGVDLRVVPAAREWFAQAEREGWGELDYSTVLAHILGRPRPDPQQ